MQLEQLEPVGPKPAQSLIDLIPQEPGSPQIAASRCGLGGATPTFVAMSRSSG